MDSNTLQAIISITTLLGVIFAIWRTREKRQTIIVQGKVDNDAKRVDLDGRQIEFTSDMFRTLTGDLKDAINANTAQLVKIFEHNIAKDAADAAEKATQEAQGRIIVANVTSDLAEIKLKMTQTQQNIAELLKK